MMESIKMPGIDTAGHSRMLQHNAKTNATKTTKLPLSIKNLLFNEELSTARLFLSDNVYEELELLDKTIILSLKNFASLIRRWHYEVDHLTIHDDGNVELTMELNRGLSTIDVLRDDYVWEHLNVGHWKSVSPMWRKTYTYLSLLKAILLLQKGATYEEAIRQCDMGLLMGEPIMENLLLSLAEELSCLIIEERLARKRSRSSEETNFIKDHSTLKNTQLVNQWKMSKFEISYENKLSLESFSEYMKNEKPVKITGSIEHWPALHKWNVQYIDEVAGFRTCPVEIGPKYTSEDWTQKLMKIDDFITKFMKEKENSTPSTVKDKSDFGYIAQHHLFDQILELRKDIKIPEYCTLGASDDVEINAWFGPANTISPTHYDPKDNLLVQVFGTKIIRLYPPSESKFLKPFPESSLLFNTSQIDLEDHDLINNHPEIQNARYCEFLLESGMVLYIPPKWWHYVKSLTPCFSVSFWFH